jgi:hypothetical protein
VFGVPLSSTLDFQIPCSERDNGGWDGVQRCGSLICIFAVAGLLPLSGADSLRPNRHLIFEPLDPSLSPSLSPRFASFVVGRWSVWARQQC